MRPDDPIDPRQRPLPPTAAEVGAWAEREHARRAAWLDGPTDLEKAEWSRRSESSRGTETVEVWAEGVRTARRAWLDGPSDQEKRDWARMSRSGSAGPPPDLAPLPEEAEAWAREENRRRREWLAGPTEAEKLEWAHRQATGSPFARWLTPQALAAEREFLSSLLHEVETAGAGAVASLARGSAALWNYLKRAGRRIERRAASDAGPRRRVPYP